VTQPLMCYAATRRAAMTAVATIGLFSAACAKADKSAQPDSTKTAANSAAAPAAVATLAAAPARTQVGDLPKPIDQMTGDELFTFTRTLSFGGGHERHRRCRGNPECRGNNPKDSTLIRVDAVEREDSLSTSGNAPNGVVGLRALNRGAMEDSVYNTRPGKQYEYYLVVLQAGPNVASWRLEELDTTPGQRSHKQVSSGSFHGCNHAFKAGARADFKTCSQAEADMKQASFGRTQTADGESPIWVSCAWGCCTADTPDIRG